MNRTNTPPPSIDPQWLRMKVLEQYPGHKKTSQGEELISSLVKEYLRLWQLVRTFPDMRVVGTGPIIAVQRVHWSFREEYFYDCLSYLMNTYLKSWLGEDELI